MIPVTEVKVAAATIPRFTPLRNSFASIKLAVVREDGVYKISFNNLMGHDQHHGLTVQHLDLLRTVTTLRKSEPKPRVVIVDLKNVAAIGADFIGTLLDLKRREMAIYLLNLSDDVIKALSVSKLTDTFNVRIDEAAVLKEISPVT